MWASLVAVHGLRVSREERRGPHGSASAEKNAGDLILKAAAVLAEKFERVRDTQENSSSTEKGIRLQGWTFLAKEDLPFTVSLITSLLKGPW